MLFDIL